MPLGALCFNFSLSFLIRHDTSKSAGHPYSCLRVFKLPNLYLYLSIPMGNRYTGIPVLVCRHPRVLVVILQYILFNIILVHCDMYDIGVHFPTPYLVLVLDAVAIRIPPRFLLPSCCMLLRYSLFRARQGSSSYNVLMPMHASSVRGDRILGACMVDIVVILLLGPYT